MPREGRPSIYGSELYNASTKEQFLNEKYSNPGTIKRYKKMFYRTYNFEIDNKKDLYNFNIEEAKDMLFALGSASPATLSSTKSILSMYQKFAYEQKYVKSPTNIYDLIDINEIRNMISTLAQENRYLRNEQELINIINLCENAQDAVCFVLAYHGLKTDDILDVEIKRDIDFENKTINVNNKTIELNDYYMEIVQDAIDQTLYTKNNGVFDEENKPNSLKLKLDLNSKYLLRGSQTSKKEEGRKLSSQVINSRIKKVVESFGNDKGLKGKYVNDTEKIEMAQNLHRQLLTLTSIFYSGIFIRLQKLEQEKGKLGQQDYIDMREKNGLTGSNWNELESRYNLWKQNL